MAFLEQCDDKRVLRGQLIVTYLWAAITGFGIYMTPDPHGHGTHQQLGLPPCPSVLFFSKPCPGCGLTTSWTATIHGHFAEAFRAHPLGPILYLLFTYIALVSLWGFFKGKYVSTAGPKWAWGIMIGAVIFFGYGAIRFATSHDYASSTELANFAKRFGN